MVGNVHERYQPNMEEMTAREAIAAATDASLATLTAT
jgi:hypothetical protein